MRKGLKIFLALAIFFLLLVISFAIRRPYGFSGTSEWGTAFSKPFAIEMGLDWEDAYLAILDDLKIKHLRLPVYWTDIEPEKGKYVFDDYDWMIEEAQKRNIELVLVVGRKLPRWPECYEPEWAQDQDILRYIEITVNRYKDYPNLYLWQVENEPFLPFGECPELDADFLDREISLVRSLDPNHEIMVTDSGELSIWVRAAKRADVFGTTLYRIIWTPHFNIGYMRYPLLPNFFWLKANLVHLFFPKKPIIVSELQTEPWSPKSLHETPLKEQEISMNIGQFRDNIEFTKRIGFPRIYLWGAEWWYWMKEKQNHPEYWEEAKKVISN